MKALGPLTQGVAAYDAGKYSRKVMQINAQNTQSEGLAERDRIRFAARQQMGHQLVDQAGSGFAVGTGTAIDALKESAVARELDILTSRMNAQGRANGYKQQGDLEYAKGYSALVGGVISGAAALADEAMAAFGGGGGGMAAAAGSGGGASGGGGYELGGGTAAYFNANPIGGV